MITSRRFLSPLILSLTLICHGCAFTDVQSILTKPVKPGSVFVKGVDDSVETKKMVEIIYSDLEKRGFTRSDYLNAEVMVRFSWGDLGPETISWPQPSTTMSSQNNQFTGMNETRMSTQFSNSSLTFHKHEFRVQFHDSNRVRSNQDNSLLWEAVGNNTALLYSDIASAAPEMIKNTLDKLNKDE